MRAWISAIAWLVIASAVGIVRAQDDAAADELFELHVRPVLVGTCARCHGTAKVSGGLRVDSREALLAGGESGPAVVPGDPAGSLVVQAIRRDGLAMPPEERERLSPETIAAFERWIAAGAHWPTATGSNPSADHWAFQPVRDVSPPADASGWAEYAIDRFIAAGHAKSSLAPVPDADRRTLLRRLYFDLIGLPPTPAEIDAFLNDPAPDAWERQVERLLASPAYGERWGRHWMDVVRYADTAGDNADYPVPEARLYRDWIIDSFNGDRPYDEFVRHQVAGDLLADPARPWEYADRIVATGFLALSRRYLTAPYEQHHLTIEDTIDTLGRAVLGLTLRCARCHDHKFDPATAEDYYALYGFFASTQYPYAGSEEFASKTMPRQHFVPLLPLDDPRMAAGEAQLEALRTKIAESEERDPMAAELGPLREELRVAQRLGLPPGVPGAYAVRDGVATDVPLQRRGDPDDVGPVVARGVPKFLAGDGFAGVPAGSSGRVQLAHWLIAEENPLTARVFVNRVWQHHFGQGIVATPSNFGTSGAAPSHPELLDWLTVRFVRGGWSVKALHRLILTSRTYRLGGAADAGNQALDPANRFLWRHARQRLEAEALRDSMLDLAGNLDRARPGEHPFPPIGQWSWTQHEPFKEVYPSNHRSVYLMTQRIQRHPYLALFDGPDPNASTDVRTSATVPLQALYLMNNPFVAEQAAGLARRALAMDASAEDRIAWAVESCWGRRPDQGETSSAAGYITRYADESQQAGLSTDQAELAAWTSYARILLTANEFVYVD